MSLFQNYRQQVKEGVGLALQVRVSPLRSSRKRLALPPLRGSAPQRPWAWRRNASGPGDATPRRGALCPPNPRSFGTTSNDSLFKWKTIHRYTP
jgi:hypothetical protein